MMCRQESKLFLFAMIAAAAAGSCNGETNEAKDISTSTLAHGNGHGGGDSDPNECNESDIALNGFALYAENSILLGPNSTVTGGDVGVEKADGPGVCSEGNLELKNYASVDSSKNVYGDTVVLRNRASIGATWTNRLINRGGTHGLVQDLPAMPPLPSAGIANPNSQSLTVARRTTVELAPNSRRGDVRLKEKAILRLRGGVYHFRTLEMDSESRIEILAPSEIRVLFEIEARRASFIGPAIGTALHAADLILSTNMTWRSPSHRADHSWHGEIVGVRFDSDSTIRALVLAPNTGIVVKSKASVRGALVGSNIEIDSKVTVEFEDGIGDGADSCAGSCNDGNPCTIDSCCGDECRNVNAPAGTSCSDGNACNGNETCNAGGACVAGTPIAVDDGNACTADSCNAAGGVTHTALANGTSCSNGNACDGAEACMAGACAPGTAPVVDDGNLCTADSCDPTGGVTHTPVANGTSCSNGNACDGAEACMAGACAPGTAPVVDDGNVCTADSCDPSGGVMHTPLPNGTLCSNGDACDGAETCMAGACAAGTAPVVDDGNPCTADSCDASGGVLHTPVAEGTSCGTDLVCNATAMCVPTTPGNAPPSVVLPAFTDTPFAPAFGFLFGFVADDGAPNGVLTVEWTTTSGPVPVVFISPNDTSTDAIFFQPGIYVVRLTASDGVLSTFAETTIEILPSPF